MQTYKHCQHKIGLEIRMLPWGFKTDFCSITIVEQNHYTNRHVEMEDWL